MTDTSGRLSGRRIAEIRLMIEAPTSAPPAYLIQAIHDLLRERRSQEEWRPIEEAPKDGRWLIAVANDRVSLYRISWGRDRKGELCWCSADNSYGDGLFSPNGGWIECPAPSPLPLPPKG